MYALIMPSILGVTASIEGYGGITKLQLFFTVLTWFASGKKLPFYWVVRHYPAYNRKKRSPLDFLKIFKHILKMLKKYFL